MGFVADKLLVACSIILLRFSFVAGPEFRIPRPLVVIVDGKDLLVAFGVLVLLSIRAAVTIDARPLGKLSTVLQLMLLIVTLLAPDLASVTHRGAAGLTRIMWWSTGIVTVASAIDYVTLEIRQLASPRPISAASGSFNDSMIR